MIQELEEAEDESGNIILIERLDGSGAVQAHIHGRDMNAHLDEIRVNPSGSMDVRMHIDSQSPVDEGYEVGAIGV